MAEEGQKETREKIKLDEKELEKVREQLLPMLSALFPRGGTFVGDVLPGAGLLDPEDPAATKEAVEALTPYQRLALALRLRLASHMLEEAASLTDALQTAEKEHTRHQEALDKNLRSVYEQMRPLEIQYRTLNQFFDNAAASPGANVSAEIFNTPPAALFEDASEPLSVLTKEIQGTNAEAFHQSKAKSILVIPGHWAENKYLNRLEALLADNRVSLFTDIFSGQRRMDNYDAIQDKLELETYKGLKQGTPGRAHMSVCANEICARQKYAWEDDNLWIPPSTTVAGRVYNVDQEWAAIKEGAAGYKRGKALVSSPMVRVKLNNASTGALANTYNLIPLIESKGDVFIMGVGSLCTDETMKQYPTVRIYDFIQKAMLDYSRTLLFERFSEQSKEIVKAGLRRFFDGLVKEGVIESYSDLTVERDGKPGEKGKARVLVNVKFFDIVTQVRTGLRFDEEGHVEK